MGYKVAVTLFDEQDKLSLLRQLVGHGVEGCDLDAVENYNHRISYPLTFSSPRTDAAGYPRFRAAARPTTVASLFLKEKGAPTISPIFHYRSDNPLANLLGPVISPSHEIRSSFVMPARRVATKTAMAIGNAGIQDTGR